jgi:Mn2+/Fe2+ NRAMP family transporter
MAGHDGSQKLHVRHIRRGISRRFAGIRLGGRSALAAFLAVLGPGLLAGLSDDDPAGIGTYAVLGAEHGYQLLWIIPLSTILLIWFHLLAVRIGAVTGLGFVANLRHRWGRRAGWLAAGGLLFANFGTICAEYAGIASAAELAGIPAWLSAPAAAVLISTVVVLGSFHRVEGVLLVISATLALYLVDGLLAGPDWGQVLRGSLIPSLPVSEEGWVVLTATLGTTLAPWGLAFIQSYAVDKKIGLADLPAERIEVTVGSVLTGVIGMAIAVACAATLYPHGVHVAEAADVARSLEPMAGSWAKLLFGAGLLGAALLAAAVVPLATAYSIAEGLGVSASLDLDARRFQTFYAIFIGLTVAAASVVVLPGLPLLPLMFSSQVVNAVLLPLHVVALLLLARDERTMGSARAGAVATATGWCCLGLIVACVAAMTVQWL